MVQAKDQYSFVYMAIAELSRRSIGYNPTLPPPVVRLGVLLVARFGDLVLLFFLVVVEMRKGCTDSVHGRQISIIRAFGSMHVILVEHEECWFCVIVPM